MKAVNAFPDPEQSEKRKHENNNPEKTYYAFKGSNFHWRDCTENI